MAKNTDFKTRDIIPKIERQSMWNYLFQKTVALTSKKSISASHFRR